MPELNLLVEIVENLGDDIHISLLSAEKLGIKDGDLVVISIRNYHYCKSEFNSRRIRGASR